VSGPVSEERLAELAANLADVRARIADACSAADRDPAEVQLIAVTKTFPVTDVVALTRLGVIDIGENKDQEAAPKAAECAAAGVAVRWHFVGQLQVNKAASVVRYATMVHSVDRIRLADALSRRAVMAGRTISCLAQVNLDPAAEPGADRGGAVPDEVPALAAAIDAADGLELAGVMAVAPLGQPARPAFVRLRAIAEMVRSAYPEAGVISAGMSSDLREAVAEGATHVRIGTALLGGRPPFVR
jgi:PLP dependent protein